MAVQLLRALYLIIWLLAHLFLLKILLKKEPSNDRKAVRTPTGSLANAGSDESERVLAYEGICTAPTIAPACSGRQ